MEFSKNDKRLILAMICILDVCCLFLATRASLFYRNMTFVGNTPQYRWLFVIWGILQSFFFAFMAFRICKKYQTKKYIYTLTISDTILNIIAYLLPYKHPGGDFISEMHVFLSFITSIFAAIILLLILKEIFYKNYDVFTTCKNILTIFTSIIIFLAMALGDFSGIMEIVFLNGMYLILYTMLFAN